MPDDRLLPPAALCQRLIADHQYGCVGIDRGGAILWANRAAERLIGRRLEDTVGTNITEFLEADAVELAWEIIEEQDVRGDFGLPMVWALQHADGHRVHVEIGAGLYFDDPEFDGMVLRLRPYDAQRCFDEFVASLARLEPLAATLGRLARWLELLLQDARVSVAHGWDGRRYATTAAHDLPALLDGSVPGRSTDDRLEAAGLPWIEAARSRELVVAATLADLPPAIAAAASEHRLAACWALPVTGPPCDGLEATLVMWRRTEGGPFLSHAGALQHATEACTLAFERHRSIELLQRAARTDALTGVSNRLAFFNALDSSRGPDPGPAVLYLDLDGFKGVNDTWGHSVGDRALVAVARALATALRPGDLLARLGGDEFAVLAHDVPDHDTAAALAERLIAAVASVRDIAGVQVDLGVSVGVALGAPGADHATLVELADRALYGAKRSGRNRWVLSTPDDEAVPTA